jgi:hypothetical protein
MTSMAGGPTRTNSTRRISMRRSHVLAVLAVLTPALALASPPSPANSTVPSCISLVGTNAAVPATAAGQFLVVVRDLANNPIAGAVVAIDLSGCPDLHLCPDQLDPAVTVDCAHQRVSKVTDGAGRVVFTLLGGSNGAGSAVTLLGGGKIYWDGTLIGSPTVSAYDLDGRTGLGANDLSGWLGDFGSGNPYGRSDYDCSGWLGANDLSLWLNAFGSGAMSSSCGASCP